MRIKDLYTDNNTIIPDSNNAYNSDEWYMYCHAELDNMLRVLHGNRDLFDYVASRDDAIEQIDALFMINAYKYRHLWDLYTAEYNPLWNVDGTERIERDRHNTGTQGNTKSGDDTLEYLGSQKLERKGKDWLEMSGTEANTRSGNETLEPSGTEKVTRDGSMVESHSGGPTSSRTTFDSATFLDTDKTVDNGKVATTYGKDGSGTTDPYEEITSFTSRKDTTTYNNVKDERSFNQRKDEQNYDSYDTQSFTERKDKTTYNSGETRTDNLNEHEVITHTRGGNIGVTMTTQLEEGEYNWLQLFNFKQSICADIANFISYVW
mgnify:CR=1 FL=1